jgi:hypothetical protein
MHNIITKLPCDAADRQSRKWAAERDRPAMHHAAHSGYLCFWPPTLSGPLESVLILLPEAIQVLVLISVFLNV